MKKIFSLSIIAMIIAMPAFATGIAKDVNPADCNSTSLGTTSGTSNLQASWQPNTLNIEWYDGDTRITPSNYQARTCTYDSGITVPANPPTKEGFAFAGWTVKVIVPPVDVSHINASLDAYDKGYARANNYGADLCYINGSSNPVAYGKDNCSQSIMADLALYDWKTRFNYGWIYGTSFCSATNGHLSGNGQDYTVRPDENTEGSYCYCKLIGYTPYKGVKQNVNNSVYVFLNNVEGTIQGCKKYCAYFCAENFSEVDEYRTAVLNAAK